MTGSFTEAARLPLADRDQAGPDRRGRGPGRDRAAAPDQPGRLAAAHRLHRVGRPGPGLAPGRPVRGRPAPAHHAAPRGGRAPALPGQARRGRAHGHAGQRPLSRPGARPRRALRADVAPRRPGPPPLAGRAAPDPAQRRHSGDTPIQPRLPARHHLQPRPVDAPPGPCPGHRAAVPDRRPRPAHRRAGGP